MSKLNRMLNENLGVQNRGGSLKSKDLTITSVQESVLMLSIYFDG